MTITHTDGPLVLYRCNLCYNQIEIDLMQGPLETHGWYTYASLNGEEHWCPNHVCNPIHAGNANIDLVNHPPHYTSHPSGVEAITICEHMDFCLGNAMKYLWRAGYKDGTTELEDLKKSRWYLDRAISNLEKQP